MWLWVKIIIPSFIMLLFITLLFIISLPAFISFSIWIIDVYHVWWMGMRMILTLSFWVCFFSLKFGCPLTFPFNVIVFLCLSLCLHMLSMYVWFCPHHDNPSLPAEGKLRRSYNAGPPVALSLAPFIYFFSPLSFLLPCLSLVIITLTALRRLKLCVCVCLCLLHGEH